MNKIIRTAILAFTLIAGFSPAFAQAPPPVPALPDAERRTSYVIAATTCICNVNFALYGDSTDYASWVEVYLNGVRVNFNDGTFGWTITSPTGALGSIPRPVTDAVLTFNGVQTGTVQIVGARRPRRTSTFAENRGVAARDLNQILNDMIAQNRETWDKTNDVTGRALISQPGNTVGLLPLPSACQSKFLGFDATGLIPQCNAGGAGSGNVVGPVSSILGHVPIFNNTTGTLLGDSGTSVRTALTAPVTLYVNPSSTTAALCNGGSGGIGSNGNLGTLAAPFLTPVAALNQAQTLYDARLFQVTIQYCDNNVTGAVYPTLNMAANLVGAISGGNATSAQLIIQGNSSTPNNVIVQGAGTIAAFAFVGVTSPVSIKDMQIGATLIGGATTGHGISADLDSRVYYSNISWGFINTAYSHIAAIYGSSVEQEGVERINGGAAAHWLEDRLSKILTTGNTITCTGTPAFPSAFIVLGNGSNFALNGAAFSGCGGVTGPRYISDMTSSFGSGTADPNTVYPGNSNGSVTVPSFNLSGLLVSNGGGPTGATNPVTAMPAMNTDATLNTGTGALTIANNAVTNAKAAQMAANTIKGNNTGGTANAADLTVAQLSAMFTKATSQLFTSGTDATYTTPANATWLEVEIIGGGGGGGGSGTAAGAATAGGNTCWNTSGTACTTPVYQGGGGALGTTNTATSSAGGAVSGSGTCNDSQAGGIGGASPIATSTTGGMGGVSRYGGAGPGGWGGANNAGAAVANSGSGGGGAGENATAGGGGGGGSGAWCLFIQASPAATYKYTIGTAGSAGTAGTGGNAGGAGAAGKIRVIEHYN